MSDHQTLVVDLGLGHKTCQSFQCINYLHLFRFIYLLHCPVSCTSLTSGVGANLSSKLCLSRYIERQTGAQGLPPNLASCMTRRIRASEDKPSHPHGTIPNNSCFSDSVRFCLRSVAMISCKHKMLACQPTPQLLLQVVHLSTSAN